MCSHRMLRKLQHVPSVPHLSVVEDVCWLQVPMNDALHRNMEVPAG